MYLWPSVKRTELAVHRWMGSTRFVVGYVQGALSQKSHGCQLAMHVIESDKDSILQQAKCVRSIPPHEGTEPGEMPRLKFGTVNDDIDFVAEGWKVIDGSLTFLYAGKLPYVAKELLQFPAAAPDGLIDVTLQGPKPGRMNSLTVSRPLVSSRTLLKKTTPRPWTAQRWVTPFSTRAKSTTRWTVFG